MMNKARRIKDDNLHLFLFLKLLFCIQVPQQTGLNVKLQYIVWYSLTFDILLRVESKSV